MGLKGNFQQPKTSAKFNGFVGQMKKLKTDGDSYVKVGLLAKSGSDLVIYAATNEYGTDKAGAGHNIKIPARPFIRPILRNRELVAFAKAQGAEVFAKGADPQQALGRIGLKGQALVVSNINSNTPPPNEDSTQKAKGSSKTLINSGRMKQSISYEVGGRGSA